LPFFLVIGIVTVLDDGPSNFPQFLKSAKRAVMRTVRDTFPTQNHPDQLCWVILDSNLLPHFIDDIPIVGLGMHEPIHCGVELGLHESNDASQAGL
jgi:hypothetical protein